MTTNRFGWYELMTTDPDAARAFYGAVIGWGTEQWQHADYTMWKAPGGPVGGLMRLPDEAKAMGAPPHWIGYVSVANAADTAARVEALGGRVYKAPTDLPNGARFAIFADPQGATFAVHQVPPGSAGEAMPAGRGLGEFSWAELLTTDPAAAFAFYAELFGWAKTSAMDMGPMGTYQMFTHAGGDNSMGGIMGLPAGSSHSAWLYYTNVADLEAAIAKVKELGGSLCHGPADVPGGGRIATCGDPQGSIFAMYAQVG